MVTGIWEHTANTVESVACDRLIAALAELSRVDVFGDPAEMGSSGFRAGGEIGLAGKLVGDDSLLRHELGMLAGGVGQGFG